MKNLTIKNLQKNWSIYRKLYVILFSIFTVLLILRLLLPYVVLHYVNNKLQNLSSYTGSVKDIDINLYRGAYVIKDITIEKKTRNGTITGTIPFFRSDDIDLSVEWRTLFKGSVVGKVYLDKPIVNFVKGVHKNEDVKQDSSEYQKLLHGLIPLRINRFEVNNGQVHFIDPNSTPRVDVAMKNIHIIGANFSNVEDRTKTLPARLDAVSDVYGGKFSMHIDFNLLKKNPTFDFQASLKEVNLSDLNSFLRAYENFEVKKGTLSAFSEFAAKEGNFGGYVKPFVKDFAINKKSRGFKNKLWIELVGTSMKLLENPKSGEVATKVNINGSFSDPTINFWKAVSLLLVNAFENALLQSLDYSINIDMLQDSSKKTILEKVFGDGKKRKNGDKKESH